MSNIQAPLTPPRDEPDKDECLATREINLMPFHHIPRGKQVRKALIEGLNRDLFGVSDKQMKIIFEATDMVHTATLLLDDVQDDTAVRRNQPAAHKVYGVPLTINCVSIVCFLALQKLNELELPAESAQRATTIFTEELILGHEGQGVEVYFRDLSKSLPTEEEYLEICRNKTGFEFRLLARLIHLLSDRNVDMEICIELYNTMGEWYQLVDDLDDLKANGEVLKNPLFAGDITEGKFTMPFIHCIAKQGQGSELLSILRQHTSDPDLKRRAIQLMQETGSFEYCEAMLRDMEVKIVSLKNQLVGTDKDMGVIPLINKLRVIYDTNAPPLK